MAESDGSQTALPAFADFAAAYQKQTPQIVWRKSVNDTDTPVSAYLKLAGQQKNAFLLESVEGGENLGRYSIIGLQPDVIWRAKNGRAEINRAVTDGQTGFVPDERPILESLRSFLAESQIDLPPDIADQVPPMFAGVFGFFGYDVINQIEDLPLNDDNRLDLHDAIFIRPTILAVFDNIGREVTFVTPVRPDEKHSATQAYELAQHRVEAAVEILQRALPGNSRSERSEAAAEFQSNVSKDDFVAMVEKARNYIRAGDIFQVVLSQRFSAPYRGEPFALYRALRRLNPSPFLFFLDFDDCTLVGSSPEILVRVRNDEITIRPIAGTRPRGNNAAADQLLEEELLNDPKELAEHLMLLDLGRNDVGRTAELGSVQVTERFNIERYSHVMHIVSHVTGKLAADADAIDALVSGFPAGTVSGAPKIRAMEIIAELEIDRRGPYAGCIGYFSADGSLDTCIALRTAIIKDQMMHIQAGAGIVADSEPYSEYLECMNKAGALMKAASLANQ